MTESAVQQAESEILSSLLKLNQSITESDVKLWKTQAHSKYYKIETEKFAIENKLIDEQIRTLEDVEKTLRQAITFQTQMKDSLLESLKVREQSTIHLKQRQHDANKETEAWCKKLAAESEKQLQVYHQHRIDLQHSSPLYKQLQEAANRTRLLEFEVKMKEKEARYEGGKCKFREELRAKMFNAAIVRFVKTIQLYHKNKKIENQNSVEEISVKTSESAQPEKQEKPIQKMETLLPIPPLYLPAVTKLTDLFNDPISISLTTTMTEQDCESDARAADMYKQYLERSNKRRLLMQKYESCEKLDLKRYRKSKEESMNETHLKKRKLPIVRESPKKTKINIIDNQILSGANKIPANSQIREETKRELAEAALPQKTKKVMFLMEPPNTPKPLKIADVASSPQISNSQKPSTIDNVSNELNGTKSVTADDKTFVSESAFAKNFNMPESKFSPYFAKPRNEQGAQPIDFELGGEERVFHCSFEDEQQDIEMSTDQSANYLQPSFLMQENEFNPFRQDMSFNLTSSQHIQQSGFTFNLGENDNGQQQFNNTFTLF